MSIAARLVALDEGPDIALTRAMVVVGRHPQCDTRLDSPRVSRHHCCMTPDRGEVIVRDLGSTNGIRINGRRVETGRLRPGDELSIAHIRYRLDSVNGLLPVASDDAPRGLGQREGSDDSALAAAGAGPFEGSNGIGFPDSGGPLPIPLGGDGSAGTPGSDPVFLPIPRPASEGFPAATPTPGPPGEFARENRLAAAVRELLPSDLADRCRIQVIVQMPGAGGVDPSPSSADAEKHDACRPDSSP